MAFFVDVRIVATPVLAIPIVTAEIPCGCGSVTHLEYELPCIQDAIPFPCLACGGELVGFNAVKYAASQYRSNLKRIAESN